MALSLAATGMPARPEEKGTCMSEPNYRIVPIVEVPAPAVLEAQRLGVGWCSRRRCCEVPTYLLFSDVRRGGHVHTLTRRFCPEHATHWCTAHHVEVARVPTIPFWDARHPEQPTPFWGVAALPVLHVPSV